MIDFEFYSAKTTDDLAFLLDRSGAKVLAGGTDILPRLRRGQFSATRLVDISRLDALNFIEESDGRVRIGSLTTHAELIDSPLLRSVVPAVVEASATVGCLQTRRRGTLGGNLANASPASDTAPRS